MKAEHPDAVMLGVYAKTYPRELLQPSELPLH